MIQDSSFLYMLFPYVVGGELFSYLRRFHFLAFLSFQSH